MPFTRADDHHLDSCWMTRNNPDTKLKVTTYPMVHIGDQQYYDRLSADLTRRQYALLEGASWRSGDAKRTLYDLLQETWALWHKRMHSKSQPQLLESISSDRRRQFQGPFRSSPQRGDCSVTPFRKIAPGGTDRFNEFARPCIATG